MRRIHPTFTTLVLGIALIAGPTQAQAQEELFVRTEAFATKNGFRAVFAWETSQPALAFVRYGTSPDNLDRIAGLVPTTPDTAGWSVAHLVNPGGTYWYEVVDDITGDTSGIGSFEAANAYNDWNGSSYTIDLVVQLDSKTLPPGIPADQSLEEIAQGMRIMAERLYDATDGYAQVGNVLVTDTLADHAVNPPFFAPACFTEHSSLADILVQTTVPFDSHTFGGWAIDSSCIAVYLGRVGQLVIPWQDDLHFGYIAAHELLHYAFNAPDLYPAASNADCRNLEWDGSLMHNTGGWNGSRWELTELDRHPDVTPCNHGTAPWSWQVLLERYTNFPPATTHPEGVHVTKARGNDAGDALRVMVLDRNPGSSTLVDFEPNLGPQLSCTDTGPQVVDERGDATGVVFEDTPAPNEPSLDILEGRMTWDPESEVLTAVITVDDLYDDPPPGAAGRYFRYFFDHASEEYFFVVAQHVGLQDEFRLVGPDGTVAAAADGMTGAFDAEADEIRVSIPAALFAERRPEAPAIAEGVKLDGFEILAQRYAGVVTPTADRAVGSCPYVVGQENTPQTVETDLTLVAHHVGNSPTAVDRLTAILTTAEPSEPIPGQLIRFFVDGELVGEAFTDAAGAASVSTRFNSRRSTASATFDGDGTYGASSDSL